MSPFLALTSFSILTVIGQILCVVFLIILLARKRLATVHTWLGTHALPLMLVVALLATLGSLFFSDLAGWTPCKLCWYQRIFMYPQVVLLAIAVWKRDAHIAPYIFALSFIGMLIAAMHYGEQLELALHPDDPSLGQPCDQTGVSCARTPSFEFGYITIPMMALTAFLLNAFGSTFILKTTHHPRRS